LKETWQWRERLYIGRLLNFERKLQRGGKDREERAQLRPIREGIMLSVIIE
jgi:hypothetical protein